MGMTWAHRLEKSIVQTAKRRSFIASPKESEVLRCHVGRQKNRSWSLVLLRSMSSHSCRCIPIDEKLFTTIRAGDVFSVISSCHNVLRSRSDLRMESQMLN